MDEFTSLVEGIRELLRDAAGSDGFVRDEKPPSAVFHTVLDGKEYIIILQGTDTPE